MNRLPMKEKCRKRISKQACWFMVEFMVSHNEKEGRGTMLDPQSKTLSPLYFFVAFV